MRIAAHGFISDGGVSSAGAFRGLLATLLELGHEVHFYGVPKFTEPSSLERYPNYRYMPMKVEWIGVGARTTRKLGLRYPKAVLSVAAGAGYQKEALRRMEQMTPAYDFVFCIDTLNLWPSRLPVFSWPQSPPHTEWAALRTPRLARTVIETEGLGFYAAVQVFYAYRWLHARYAMPFSDLLFSSSRWAHDLWLEFGLPQERLQLLPYPIEFGPFEDVPPAPPEQPTFLWLGRAVPRKRIDLFLEAFDRVHARRPEVQAHIVGNMSQHAAAQNLLAARSGDPAIRHTNGIPRSEVPALFGASHVLVQPSENENFGFAVAEALAAGRPVVTGPTNGTGAYGGAATFGFDRYEPDAVAEAMERALDAVLRDPQGVAATARAAARASFDPVRVAGEVCRAAERVIARKRGTRV